jgi:hypothetical protein
MFGKPKPAAPSPKPAVRPSPNPAPPASVWLVDNPTPIPTTQQVLDQIRLEAAHAEVIRIQQEQLRAIEEQTRLIKQKEFDAMLHRLYPTIPR